MNNWIPCRIETIEKPSGKSVIVHAVTYVQPPDGPAYVETALVERGEPGKTHTLGIEPASFYFNTDKPRLR